MRSLLRPSWWVCLWRGHDPGESRDWVGRPLRCERCGEVGTRMARWQMLRWYGEAAQREWNRKAVNEMALRRREGSGG